MTKCPQCGYDEGRLNVNPMNNFMNEYVDDTGKVDGIYNGDAEKIEVKGKKLTRKDLWKKPVASTPSTPVK